MKSKVFLLNELEFKNPDISHYKLRKYKYIKSLQIFAARTKSLLIPSKVKYTQQITLNKALLTSTTTSHVQQWFRTRFGSYCKVDNLKATPANRKQLRTIDECHVQYPEQIKALRYYQTIDNLCIDLLFFSSPVPDFGLLNIFTKILRRIKHIETICLLNNPPVFSESLLNNFLFLLTQLDNVGSIKLDIAMDQVVNNNFLQVFNQKKVQNLQVKYLGFDNLFWLNKHSFPENFSGLQELSLKITELTDKQGLFSFVTTNLQKLNLKAFGLDISFRKCEKEYFRGFLEAVRMPKTLSHLRFKFTDISFLDYLNKRSDMVEDNGRLSQSFLKAWGDIVKDLGSVAVLDLTLGFSEQLKPSYADCVMEMVRHLKGLKAVRVSVYDCYSNLRANQTLGQKRMFDFHMFCSVLADHKQLKSVEIWVPFMKFGDPKREDNSYKGMLTGIERVQVSYNTDPGPQDYIEGFLSSLPETIKQLTLRFCEVITDSDEIERRTLLISRFKDLQQLELTFQIKYMHKEIFINFFKRLCELKKLATLKVAFMNLHLDQDTIQQVEQLFWGKARHMKLVKIRIHNALLVWEGKSFARKAPELIR